MKRILHISKYYEPFKGGTEMVARNCVRALEGRCEQKVICFNHEPDTRTDQVDGVEILRVGCFAKVASQSLSLRYGARLRKLVAGFQPDVVIFHYPNPFVAHYLLGCIPPQAKLVIFWHLDIVRQKLLGKLFNGQNRRLVRRADRLVAASPQYAQGSPWLVGAQEKVRLIPDCIDAERLVPDARAMEKAKQVREEAGEKILCLAVGRHTRYKGFDVLIEAARELDDRFLVCIAGTGEETKALTRQARGMPHVRFLGQLDDAALLGYMQAMDIFCFPSVTRNEAFGLALAEAMYMGKPAVTFSIPDSGVSFVCLNGEDGLEVPNADAGAFADAIRTLADHPELRASLGANGRRRVEENFLYEQFERRVRALMDELINEGEG